MTEAPHRDNAAKRVLEGLWSWLFPERKLIPSETIAGRALVTVIAIMTFLAALTAGSAVLIYKASQEWSSVVAKELTIQIKPALGRDVAKDTQTATAIARQHPGIEKVTPFTSQQSAKLLEPWLGPDLNVKDLPIPRLIVIKRSSDTSPDLASLKDKLVKAVPNAVLDNHQLWVERLTSMARALFIAALVVLVLVLTSMMLAVSFATRGAMAGSREIIDVLHFVGAEDRYIAREFQRHFLILGLQGGIAGGLLAALVFLFVGWLLSGWMSGPGGEQVVSMFGTFSLGWNGFLAIGMISLAMALLTAVASRMAVARRLSGLM